MLLNSRRREATGADEYGEYNHANAQQQQQQHGQHGQQQQQQQHSGVVGPSGLLGNMERPASALSMRELQLQQSHGHHASDGYSQHSLGPSLLDRSAFSLDFQQPSTSMHHHTPLIQYDHDDHFSNVSSAQLSPKLSAQSRFGQDQERMQSQQQQQQQQQGGRGGDKYNSQPYGNYNSNNAVGGGVSNNNGGGVVPNDYLDRVSSPGLEYDHTFPPQSNNNNNSGLLHSSQHQMDGGGGGYLPSRSHASMLSTNPQSQGQSSRSSTSSISYSTRSDPLSRFSGAMSPMDSPQIRSRDGTIGGYSAAGSNAPSGLSSLSANELGWIQEEIARSQRAEGNNSSMQQHGNSLLPSSHSTLLSSHSSQSLGGAGGPLNNIIHPHHHRGGSNSAPGSNRASTNPNNGSDLSPLMMYESLANGERNGGGGGGGGGGVNGPSSLVNGGVAGVTMLAGGGGVMDDMKLKKYKTVLCQRMMRRNLDLHWYFAVRCEKRNCLDAECRYAHNDHEVLYHPRVYKTRSCVNFTKPGGCNRKMYCSFAHGSHELRFHNNTNLLTGGPGNVFGLPGLPGGPPSANSNGNNGLVQGGLLGPLPGVITSSSGMTIIPPPGVLPPLSLPGGGQQQQQQQPQSQQQQATLTIAGGSQVLPRELVASLQASGINISAPGESSARASMVGPLAFGPKPVLGGGVGGSNNVGAKHFPSGVPSQSNAGVRLPLLGAQGTISSQGSNATSPRPSGSPLMMHALDANGAGNKDAFQLGLGDMRGGDAGGASSPFGIVQGGSSQQQQQQQHGSDHLSPQFAQLGLGSSAPGASPSDNALHTAAQQHHGGAVVGGASASSSSSSESGFRETTDHLKIRILDLVDEVASMHYNRAIEDQNAAMHSGHVLKILTANLTQSSNALVQTKQALAVYAGEEAALAALSTQGLDALQSHLQGVLNAIANAKAKQQTQQQTAAASSTPPPATDAAASSDAATGIISPMSASSPQQQSSQQQQQQGRCLSCSSDSVSALVWPCAHKVVCANCNPESCPSCGAAVTKIVPLFNELPSLAALLAPSHPVVNITPEQEARKMAGGDAVAATATAAGQQPQSSNASQQASVTTSPHQHGLVGKESMP